MSPYARMMKKVEKTDECWLFTGALDQNGHGNVRVFRNGRWSCTKAHRISFEVHHGPVPDGKVVRHRCDVRNCVNPDHLVAGTSRENTRDMIDRNRGRNQYGAWSGKKVPIDADCPF